MNSCDMGQCRKVFFGSSKQHMTSWIASVVLFGKIPTLRQNAMTGGPALRFCFAFLQATARAWIPQKPIYKYTHIPITRLPLPDTPESAWTQHGCTQTSRQRAGRSHTQHWATHGRPRQSQLRRSTAACRHRVTHTHTPPHH